MNSRETLKKNWLQITVLALPFILAAAFWSKFPARVVSHWNIHGHPDGWMDRGPGLLLLPVINIAIWALFTGLPYLDPRTLASQEPGRMTEVLRVWRLALTFYFSFLSLLGMAFAAGIPVDMNRMITNGMLILFLIIGNSMGNLRPNSFAGIRTPWTLDDPEIWRATHRIGARILFYGSLGLLLAQWLLNGEHLLFVSLGFLLGCSIWSFAYSFLLFRRKNRATP